MEIATPMAIMPSNRMNGYRMTRSAKGRVGKMSRGSNWSGADYTLRPFWAVKVLYMPGACC